jgi:hypothetical protein
MSRKQAPTTIVLVTVGYGGTTLYHAHEPGQPNARTHTSGDWYDRLDNSSDDELTIPLDTPVVDCTVEGCDTIAYGVYGPMFAADLGPDEYFELLDGVQEWQGQRLSGMATCGRDVFLAHASHLGCDITVAGSGEPYPLPERELMGAPDARKTLIALGVATNPSETVAAVVLNEIAKEPSSATRARLAAAAGGSQPSSRQRDASPSPPPPQETPPT